MSELTVRDIVVQWLKDNGYDGLYNDRCKCCCSGGGDCIETECSPGMLVDGKIVERSKDA